MRQAPEPAVLVTVLLLAGCGRGPPPIHAGDLSILPGYVNPAPGGDGGVAYFVTRNGGGEPDTLQSVAVAGARAAHLHTVARAGGPDRMTPLDRPPIPPGGALVLRPGEAHLMFEGLGRALHLGDTVRIQLRFARNGQVEVPLVVRPYGG
jgi:periplasmic copper chaperone A